MTYTVVPKGDSLGKIVIDNSVIHHIVVNTVNEAKDVYFDDNTGKRSVAVNIDDKHFILDIKVRVQYGQNVDKVCAKLQENLTRSLDLMVDCENPTINIIVSGFKFN